MSKKIIILFSVLVFCFLVNPLISEAQKGFLTEGPVYLKVNIHYQDNGKDCKASYANYIRPGEGHKILAVNSPVQIKKWGRKGFIIIDTQNKVNIYFEYQQARMQMPIAEYLNIITSTSKVSLDKFSEKDKKGIKDGVAAAGMTKEGIMTALGYPATHKTPSPEANRWTYWANRFKTIAVNFNDKGIVTDITE